MCGYTVVSSLLLVSLFLGHPGREEEIPWERCCNFTFYTSFSCIAESVPMWYLYTYIWPLPAGLFRAGAAQRDRLNPCEGTFGYRQTVMNDPEQQPSQMLLTWTHDLPHNSPSLNPLSYRCAVLAVLAVLFHLFWLPLCQNHFFFLKSINVRQDRHPNIRRGHQG